MRRMIIWTMLVGLPFICSCRCVPCVSGVPFQTIVEPGAVRLPVIARAANDAPAGSSENNPGRGGDQHFDL